MPKFDALLVAVLVVGLAVGPFGVGIAEAGQQNEKRKDKTLVVAAILESVDAKKAVLTAALGDNQTAAAQRLLSLVTSDRKPAPGEIDRVFKFVYAFNKPAKLVDVPVRSDATITSGKDKLQLKDLKPGRAVTLQLATDRTMGLAVVGIHVVVDDRRPPRK